MRLGSRLFSGSIAPSSSNMQSGSHEADGRNRSSGWLFPCTIAVTDQHEKQALKSKGRNNEKTQAKHVVALLRKPSGAFFGSSHLTAAVGPFDVVER